MLFVMDKMVDFEFAAAGTVLPASRVPWQLSDVFVLTDVC